MPGTGAFLDRLRHGPPLVLDGPVGTELARRGVDVSPPLWSARAILEDPVILESIHRDHHRAGAEVHTAATFRTNARTLERAGVAAEGARLVADAVGIARRALRGAPADAPGQTWVAGSMAPLEDCYRPDLVPDDDTLRGEHALQAERLFDAGADLLLIETMNTVREAAAAIEAARETGLPILVSFVIDAEGRILSGETMEDAVLRLRPLQPDAILVNCGSIDATTKAVARLRSAWEGPWGAYANAGRGDALSGWRGEVTVDDHLRAAQRWLDDGARIIGGCCGTRPEHIRGIARLVRQARPVRSR